MGSGTSLRLSNRVVMRSAVWRFVEALGGECLALLVFVCMARILAPESFGLIALAGVMISGGQATLQGIAEAVVQGRELASSRFTTAFWGNLGLGVLLMVAMGALAGPLATLFGDPELAPVLMTLSLVLPLGGAAAVIQARLIRRMAFGAVACRALVASGVGGVVGLGLAAMGAGIWALVGLQLSAVLAGLATLMIADRWRPRLIFDWLEARSLARFALPVAGSQLARFAGQKLDIAILGLFVTTASVGHYMLATRLIFTLGLVTHYTICSLSLPVLSRLAGEPLAFRQAATRVLWFAVAFCLPAGLGLASVAGMLVPMVFGEAWAASVRPMQVLAASAIFPALGLICGQILVAAGHPKRLLSLTLASTALFLTLVALAAPFGLTAAALAGAFANALMLPTYFLALKRCVGLDGRVLLHDLLPLVGAAALMIASVLALELWLAGRLSGALLLPLSVGVGALSYAAAVWLLASAKICEVLEGLDLQRGPAGDRDAAGALAPAPRQSMSRAPEILLTVLRSIWQRSFVRWGRAATTALTLRLGLHSP